MVDFHHLDNLLSLPDESRIILNIYDWLEIYGVTRPLRKISDAYPRNLDEGPSIFLILFNGLDEVIELVV